MSRHHRGPIVQAVCAIADDCHVCEATQIHKCHVPLQDNSNMGIKATLSRFSAVLKMHDRELWYHLDVKNQVRLSWESLC